MAKDFLVNVFTSPEPISNEAEKINRLFETGVDYVHVRKPDSSLRDIKNLIEDIYYPFRKRIKLHGHFELLNEMTLGGVHLNKRNPLPPHTAIEISKSLHSIDELKESENFAYVTLSPIFNSISKVGYDSKFNLDRLSPYLTGKKVLALGGITPDKFLLLKEKGFSGACLLGYIWEGDFDNVLTELGYKIAELNN